MKRTLQVRVELTAYVELPIEDDEQITADPTGEMSDGEAAIEAVLAGLNEYDTFIFGEDAEPARVYYDVCDDDCTVEGEE